MKYCLTQATGLTLAALLSLGTGSAFAAGADEQRSGLEEVLVTAQKREQTLMEVPLSVSAFGGNFLEEIGADTLADFLQTAPGVSIIGANSGVNEINIRGISSTFGDSPVGYYLDEVSFSLIANTAVVDVRTYDLERVEVLRGPQGTLYGDGSIGGVVRVLTHNPVFNEFQFKADVDVAATKDSDEISTAYKAAANIPLVDDKLALRVVGSNEDIGGWVDSRLTGEEDVNGRKVDNYRAKLRYAPTDALDIVLGAWDYTSNNGGLSSMPDRTTNLAQNESEDAYRIYSLTADYDFSNGASIVSATSTMDFSLYSLGDIGGFPYINDQTQDLFQSELRFSSSTEGRFYWTAGAYYREITRDLAAQVFTFNFLQFSDSKAWAVFSEGTWTFMDDALDVTLGLRYFEDKRTRLDQPDLIGSIDSSFDTITPRFNIAFHPTEDWMIYGNIARGFRSGQIQPVVSIITAAAFGIDIPIGIDAETLWSYEIGTKFTGLDGRFSLEAAGYYNDWQDLQVSKILDPVTQLSALLNAGAGGVLGLEFNLLYEPLDGLTLQAGGNINNAEYKDDLRPSPNIADGQQISGVPDTTFNASVTYRRDLTSGFSGYARGGVQYTAERRDDANFALPSDEVTTFDVRAGIDAEHWGAFVFVDNLTDEDGTFSPIFLNSFGNGARFRPRTIGVNLQYRY